MKYLIASLFLILVAVSLIYVGPTTASEADYSGYGTGMDMVITTHQHKQTQQGDGKKEI